MEFLEENLKGARPYFFLFLFCCCLYLPGIATIPPTDRDESRYIQATRQMLETGDFTEIKFQDSPRNKKPIGIYWLQALSVSLFSSSESTAVWPYRLPSFFAATLAVLLTFYFGTILVSSKAAFVAALMLSSCLTLVAEAHLAKTDATLLACSILALGLLGKVFCSQLELSIAETFLLWGALGAGTLVKGPVLPGIFLLTVATLLVYEKKFLTFKQLRPFLGLLIFCLVVLPWIRAFGSETGSNFIKESFFDDIFPKLISGQESHYGPPGFYLLLSWAGLWPWSIFLGPLIYKFGGLFRSSDRSIRFLMAWLIPSWILLELVPTKLPHYTLPLYPALALLVAPLALGATNFNWRVFRLSGLIWSIMSLLLAGIFLGGPIFIDGQISIVAGLLSLFIVGAVFFFWRSEILEPSAEARVSTTFAICAVLTLCHPLFFGSIFPYLQNFWLSKRMANTFVTLFPNSPEISAEYGAIGFREPSLVFLLGTKTKLLEVEEGVLEAQKNCHLVLAVRDREKEKFLLSAKEKGLEVKNPITLSGFNYSNGKWMNIYYFKGSAPCEE